ncbi:MAG: hypothetical protein OXC40_02045 [Proteobacteria bacterium]|nr:hypothetical protein [Pseudomonadota bacterium]
MSNLIMTIYLIGLSIAIPVGCRKETEDTKNTANTKFIIEN